jgi:cytochrome c553
MRQLLAALLLMTPVLAATPASAQTAGNAERGEVLAETCLGCHGIAGYRNTYPSYRVPKLGGQNADYIVAALQGYRAQTRAHNTMHAQAASMTDADIRDVAAYLVSQGAAKAGAPVATAASDKVATCAACHGEAGISPAPNWPNLAGQYADYLEHAIRQYKTGARKDPVMGAQAQAIKDEDIRLIAEHFAAQSGLYTVDYTN